MVCNELFAGSITNCVGNVITPLGVELGSQVGGRSPIACLVFCRYARCTRVCQNEQITNDNYQNVSKSGLKAQCTT